MGSCMSESLGPNVPRANNYNPIRKIVQEFSIEKLRERWDSAQLKQVESNIKSLDRKHIKFDQFIQIFPKLNKFTFKTQKKIYDLFAYDGSSALSKQELINSLTLIRKVNQNADFAPFIFYIYSKDPKHQQMTKDQLKAFQDQNKHFYSEELLSHDQPASIRDIDKISDKNGSGINFSPNNRELNGKNKAISLEQFKTYFQRYNLSLYQQVFGWDLLGEERELVGKLNKDGIVRKHGDKVFVLEYQWFRQWRAYAERKYKAQIQIKEIEVLEMNYISNMGKRKSRNSGFLYQSNKSGQKGRDSTKIEKPGQIKNYILKSGKNDNQLVENLVELNNYICVPEEVWNKLVAIYHGGPAIQRIYPQIYYNTVLHVEVSSDGKFLTKKPEKYTNKDKSTVGEFQRSTEIDYLCYYKYPGRYNWTYLQNLRAESKDIFNCPRTYLVFVPPDAADNFQASYNIYENKKGQRCLRKRLKNYGAQINVSIDGVLTKAQVVQIGEEQQIVIQFIGENGRIIRQSIKIDEKIKNLNPENLSSENQLNQLSGLTNIGNTCYMNAVLQCLIRTPSFGGYLQKQNFADKKEGEELVLEQISKIYMQSKSNSHETVSTKSFKRIFDKHCPFFQGNSQHDAQEFLICFLSRISEEIKSKRTEYGLKEIKIENQQEQKQSVNKKVVKFFSGQTEAITECLRCQTKGVRKEPFFTYSLSLPDPDLEYTYFLIENHINANSTVPTRHGITLSRKVTIEQFIATICKQHNKSEDCLALYTVFNNQILNRLQPYSFQKEIGHHLNFNTRLVCYQLKHMCSPSYENFRNREFSQCSIKIQLRQRIYSEKTAEYKVIYLPYLLEVDQHMFWKDVKAAIGNIISKLKKKEMELSERQLLEGTPFGGSALHNTPVRESQILIQEELSNLKQSTSHYAGKNREGPKKSAVKASFSLNPDLPSSLSNLSNAIDNYKIRVIKSDHYKQNFCVFCKEEFILNRYSRSSKTCKGCGFDEQTELFKNSNFRNIYDNIIIAIDWEGGIPDFQPFVSDRSYELSEARTLGRHDKLEDLLIKNLSNKETLELRCEKETCRYDYAQRSERILVAPNILLIHLKRFTYEDNMLFKLTNNVLYPLELTLPGSKERYELYGAVAHIGSGVGGHYISYVRVMQRWYKCDDTRVTLAAEGQEIDCNAYLLFYKRVDFEPSLMCLSF